MMRAVVWHIVWSTATHRHQSFGSHNCTTFSSHHKSLKTLHSAVTSGWCVTAKLSGLLTHLSEHVRTEFQIYKHFLEQLRDAKHAWFMMMVNNDGE